MTLQARMVAFQGRQLPALRRRVPLQNWVAVEELNLSYYIGETLLIAIYTHCNNLT